MKLIVGLGNPGTKYDGTRHNVGRNIVEKIQKDLSFTEPFTKWSKNERLKAQVSEGHFGREKIILAIPETYMNLSGESVNSLACFFKLSPEDIFVVYDDLDLNIGLIKIRPDGSSGGHKGVLSTINHLGSKLFVRFRVGIRGDQPHIEASEYVLQKFSKEEQPIIRQAMQTVVQSIKDTLQEGVEAAMNKYNAKNK